MVFTKETDLCAAFIKMLPKGWTAYAETGGFDILLVRGADGFQIGVEAKLKLNAKVICQAAENQSHWHVTSAGPDCRAVLIPAGVSMDMAAICPRLGITVIKVQKAEIASWGGNIPGNFHPHLPDISKGWPNDNWYECAPATRVKLPDYIPDVISGDAAPLKLTQWKIGAIKLVITLEKRGFLTRGDFKHFEISMSRWTQYGWLKLQSDRRVWVAGRIPNFRAQHPTNYAQIEAGHQKWKSPDPAVQEVLL